MRITHEGNVGIGTIPDSRFHTKVNDSFNHHIIETSQSGSKSGLQLKTSEGKWILENRLAEDETASDFIIRQSGGTTPGEKLVVKQTSGHVGIGTDSPSAKLEVYTASDNKDGAYGNLADSLLLKNTSDMVGAGPKLVFYNANRPGSPTSTPSALIGLQRVDNASHRGNLVFYTR